MVSLEGGKGFSALCISGSFADIGNSMAEDIKARKREEKDAWKCMVRLNHQQGKELTVVKCLHLNLR